LPFCSGIAQRDRLAAAEPDDIDLIDAHGGLLLARAADHDRDGERARHRVDHAPHRFERR
jgi:hypothetical protein